MWFGFISLPSHLRSRLTSVNGFAFLFVWKRSWQSSQTSAFATLNHRSKQLTWYFAILPVHLHSVVRSSTFSLSWQIRHTDGQLLLGLGTVWLLARGSGAGEVAQSQVETVAFGRWLWSLFDREKKFMSPNVLSTDSTLAGRESKVASLTIIISRFPLGCEKYRELTNVSWKGMDVKGLTHNVRYIGHQITEEWIGEQSENQEWTKEKQRENRGQKPSEKKVQNKDRTKDKTKTEQRTKEKENRR